MKFTNNNIISNSYINKYFLYIIVLEINNINYKYKKFLYSKFIKLKFFSHFYYKKKWEINNFIKFYLLIVKIKTVIRPINLIKALISKLLVSFISISDFQYD